MAAHAALAALILAAIFPLAGSDRRRALIRWWSGKLLRILNVTRRIDGELPHAAGIVAPNHIAWLDIFVVLSVVPARFIAKSEIRAWPVAGWIAARAGTIFIRRDRRRDTARINALVHDALAEGEFIGLFPEGTTGDGGELLRFHSSLFEPAVANGALVYPAAIRYIADDGTPCAAAAYGARTFMQSLALIIRESAFTATLRFGAPLATRGASRRDIALRARTSVATLLAAPERHTRPETRADPPRAAR